MEREQRSVRVQTIHGAIQGVVAIGAKVRTLDELNVPSHKFLIVDAPEVCLPGCCFDRGTVGINKDSVLFVTELRDCHPRTDQRVERFHFVRMPIRLRLGQFDVQGFLHIRGLRDPLIWFSQTRQLFLALTAASVVGPDAEFATAFIAVNPRHVLAIQGMGAAEPAPLVQESLA